MANKDYSGFYKRYTANRSVIYLVAKKLPDSPFYNVITTVFPSQMRQRNMYESGLLFEMDNYDWTTIDEAEYLLSKIT